MYYENTGIWRDYPELRDKPELSEYQTYYLGDFYKIASRRGSNGFGANPLTWMDILVFFLAGMHGVEDDLKDYLNSIASIDNVWLTLRAEKDKAEQAKRDAEMNRNKHRR